MSENQATFDDLLIDEEEVSETLLTETLIDYVRIGSESGAIVPQAGCEDLTNRQKIFVILLTQHALEGLDMTEEHWLTPSAIADQSGIKKGSVYPIVRELDEDGVVESDDGSYRVPMHSFEAAKEHLPEDETDE